MVSKINLESLQLYYQHFIFSTGGEILPVSQNTVVARSSSLLFLLYALG